MSNIKTAVATLCLSGLAIGGMAAPAFASTTSVSAAATISQPVLGASWCQYRVVNARRGLYVRKGPSTRYEVIGGLLDSAKTSGDCGSTGGWVHLSWQFPHWYPPYSARGWSYGHYLRKI